MAPVGLFGELIIMARVLGVIFDRTGSYQLAFVLSAIMALVAFFSSIFIVEKKHRVVS